MKSINLSCLVGLLFWPLISSAQDLSQLDTVAHYSLMNTNIDVLGQQADIELINAPYAGPDGVFSNGNYIGSDPDSCLIHTPALTALYAPTFAIQLEFKLDSLNNPFTIPMLNCGYHWRYLGFDLHYDNYWMMRVNNIGYEIPNMTPEADKWYTLTIVHDSLSTKSSFYLDGMLVGEKIEALVRPADDAVISNTNAGTGRTFRGYWRNLRVYSNEPTTPTSAIPSNPSFQVFPNPTTWGVKIQSDNPETDVIQVFAQDGKFIMEYKLENGDLNLIFPEIMKNGVYTLCLKGANGRVAYRSVFLFR